MAYKRILLMQDISCVGQCSTTVAFPILSVCGHETCIFPTALLSTHTGGFGKPAVVHLDEQLAAFRQHWKENQITFDAVLVGYLGSEAAIDAAEAVIDELLAPGGISIVDPAMADHGKRYSGLSAAYAEKMEKLCRRADIILPNVTEAAMFSNTEYRHCVDPQYVQELLDKLQHPCVVLTGVGYRDGETGIVLREGASDVHIAHKRVDRNFHGTGDMFAACFVGAVMQGRSKQEAVQIAGEFVLQSILNTMESPVHWYGVKFETALPKLIQMLQLEKTVE